MLGRWSELRGRGVHVHKEEREVGGEVGVEAGLGVSGTAV